MICKKCKLKYPDSDDIIILSFTILIPYTYQTWVILIGVEIVKCYSNINLSIFITITHTQH